MVQIINTKNSLLTHEKIIYFGKTSINFVSTQTFYIISDEILTSFEMSFLEGYSSYFDYYKIIDGVVVNTSKRDRHKIDLAFIVDSLRVENGKHVYNFSVSFSPDKVINETEELHSGYFDLSYSTATISDKLRAQFIAEAVGMSEQLVVSLQNLKRFINEDYMIAFKETSHKAKDFDYKIYNQKIREYLLNIFTMSTLHGSYKNLFTVLKYFGYGELLELKEYWVDDNYNYKSTSIYNVVKEYLDKSLSGYTKTNMMSLVYQLNSETSSDDDGLPIYSKIYEATDEILIKLEALKRVLEKDFLHFNTFIVDIIGEFQTVVGQELNVLSNLASIDTINISDNLNVDASIISKQDEFYIGVNSAFVKELLVKKNSQDGLEINDEYIDYDSEDIFEIERVLSDDIDFDDAKNDFKVLTKLYTGTFAIINFELDFTNSRYQSYRSILLDEEGQTVFDTKYRDISLLTNSANIGIRLKGKYTFLIYLIDHFNNVSVCGINKQIEIFDTSVEIFIGLFEESKNIDDSSKIKILDEWSTFESNKDDVYLVPSVKNEDLDINSWDNVANLPEMIISRKYAKDYDQKSVYSTINQLNRLVIEDLKDIPLHSWGSKYCVGLFDIIGDDTISGLRELTIKHSNDDDSDAMMFAKEFVVGDNKSKWISDFIKNIKTTTSEIEDTIYSDFTYNLHSYTDNQDGSISDAKTVMRIISLDASYSSRIIEVEMNEEFKSADFVDQYSISDENIFGYQEAMIETIINPATSELTVIFDNEDYFVFQQHEITDAESFVEFFNSNRDLNKHAFAIENKLYENSENSRIIIISNRDIVISHEGLNGSNYAITRGNQFKYAKSLQQGSTISIGRPFLLSITNASRFSVGNIQWRLYDELDNKLISTQDSLVFKEILSKPSTYSVELDFTLNGIQKSERLSGVILCLENK